MLRSGRATKGSDGAAQIVLCDLGLRGRPEIVGYDRVRDDGAVETGRSFRPVERWINSGGDGVAEQVHSSLDRDFQ